MHVTVTANARLHLGFLDLNGGLGRMFGSIGLAVSQPASSLTLRRRPGPENTASGTEAKRGLLHLNALCRSLDLRPGLHLEIASAIPSHVGLGSGTQLALAIGAALRALEGLAPDTRADALLLQRGARSGIGAALFDRGGLVVDGGQGAVAGVPPVLTRMDFPDSWRIVLVMDRSLHGLHGPDEPAAFAALPKFSAAASGEICRLVLMQALPALVERDIGPFGAAITQVQAVLGDYFAPAQGGRFTSPRVSAALASLLRAGAAGVGQSSWGPTGFAFARDEAEAMRLAAAPREGVDMLVCSGLNHAATITRF